MAANVNEVEFVVRGSGLTVADISARFGMSPTRGYNAGEPYTGKQRLGDKVVSVERQRPPFGLWELSSSNCLGGEPLDDHVFWLLDKLDPVASQVSDLVLSPDYEVTICLTQYYGCSFFVEAETIARLASYCNNFLFSAIGAEEQ